MTKIFTNTSAEIRVSLECEPEREASFVRFQTAEPRAGWTGSWGSAQGRRLDP